MEHRGSLVLVVDDEELVLTVIHHVLDMLGMSVVEVQDGESAVEKLGRRKFDLVIADKNLPGINGLQVLREAKNYDPTMGTLLVTGFSSRESAEEAMAIGVDDYIVKPFEVEDLAAKVKEALDRRAFRRDVTPQVFVRNHRLRVLLADLDEESRSVLTESVQAMGHSVRMVESLREILDAISEEACDAILCDVDLLEDDPDATRSLRTVLLMESRIPFVTVARESDFESAILSLQSGASRVLVRPLESPDSVIGVLQECFLSGALGPGLDAKIRGGTNTSLVP